MFADLLLPESTTGDRNVARVLLIPEFFNQYSLACWREFCLIRAFPMQTDTTPHLPVNHVFVDLENVKTIDPSVIGGKNLTLHLFLGPHNKKLDIEVVEKLLENSQTVKMIRSPKAGKNALDFVLAYHLGQAVLADPKGYFHIVSKDAGFDSLVDFLKSKQVKAKRHGDWSALNFQSQPKLAAAVPAAPAAPTPPVSSKVQAAPKPPANPAMSEAAEKLTENLKKLAKTKRPKKEKGLIAHAKSLCGKDVSEVSVVKVLGELKKALLIKVDEKSGVTYQL